MSYGTARVSFRRGQRTDLHITTLRNEAEDVFGEPFAEAAGLRKNLNDPQFSDDQYDAAVIGLSCGILLRVRPLPSGLREAVGILLRVQPADRATLVTVPVVGGESSVQARIDRTAVELVIHRLKDRLYSAEAVAGPFTDLGCGLDGLKLTWSRDILSEADPEGVISIDGLRRIRSKLTEAVIGHASAPHAILLDSHGRAIHSGNSSPATNQNEKRLQLIGIIERAIGIGSTVQCVPSRLREERVAAAFEPAPPQEAGRTESSDGSSRKNPVSSRRLLPSDRTPFDSPQIYSVPSRRRSS